MKFKATDNQIKQIALNAINASIPVGMGVLHYENKDYTLENTNLEIAEGFNNSRVMFIDYFSGRMVKLALHTDEKGNWVVPNSELRSDYQSWHTTYPTYNSLIQSVEGIEILEEITA